MSSMRVTVYKNLNKGCWSIAEATRKGGRGRLLSHADAVTLRDVQFHVRESRRLVVASRRCREVHAWATGTLADTPTPGARIEVTYNPYRASTFTLRDGTPVHSAACVEFSDRAYLVQLPT